MGTLHCLTGYLSLELRLIAPIFIRHAAAIHKNERCGE